MALISQRAYARRRGISQAAVWKRTTAAGGPIPTHGPRKLIDPAEADGLWDATQSAQGAAGAESARPTSTAHGGTIAQARAAAVVLDVRLRQLQLDQRRGTLISRDRAVLKAFAFARTIRDSWQGWPARAASRREAAAPMRSRRSDPRSVGRRCARSPGSASADRSRRARRAGGA